MFKLVTSVACFTVNRLPVVVTCIDEVTKKRTYLNHGVQLRTGGDGVIDPGKG